MTGTDPLQSQVEGLHARLRKLENQLRSSQQQMAKVVELLEVQGEQLRAQQTSVARVDRIQMEMLTGRVWRTIHSTSGVFKRLLGRRAAMTNADSLALSNKRSYLTCDEPSESDRTPRSGAIAVRGWCLAEGGVDSVRLEVPGLETVSVVPSLARPDVKKAHPDLDKTGRAGFLFEFESSSLVNGTYPITLRLFAGGVPVRETHTVVTIDHEKGFASAYDRWIHDFEAPDHTMITLRLPLFRLQPRISIVMPVFNTDPAELTAAIESVLKQSYGNWELCIADDGSTKPEAGEIVRKYRDKEDRIKVVFREQQGGISAACNTAADLATGDFLTFLDHDDVLAPHALAYVCELLDRQPDADMIYSDEDKIDRRGRRYEPFFKPDWSPDLLLSENYICHLLVLRSDLVRRIGGFRSDCDGSQDYDLVLKATGEASNIQHISKVLYHWRAGVASTASTIDNKHYALAAAQRAIAASLEQTNPGARLEPSQIVGRWRVRYPISDGARVSIIIASGGKAEILRTNIESIQAKTTYPNYEIVIVDNSKSFIIKNLVEEFNLGMPKIRYVDQRNKPFNYSALNNTAARECDSPILLFLNDDTSVIAEDWLGAMVELVERPEVGAVGAKLLYPDGRIQHAGVVMGLFDNCGHAFKSLDGSTSHYFDFSDVIRNVCAVTGACLMAKSQVFWQVGGFDETDFAVAFNDIDLCLKIGAAGHRVLYTPHALLHHYEAFSKTSKDLIPHPLEVARMRSKWGDVIAHDPFYSPNLTRNDEDYSLKRLS